MPENRVGPPVSIKPQICPDGITPAVVGAVERNKNEDALNGEGKPDIVLQVGTVLHSAARIVSTAIVDRKVLLPLAEQNVDDFIGEEWPPSFSSIFITDRWKSNFERYPQTHSIIEAKVMENTLLLRECFSKPYIPLGKVWGELAASNPDLYELFMYAVNHTSKVLADHIVARIDKDQSTNNVLIREVSVLPHSKRIRSIDEMFCEVNADIRPHLLPENLSELELFTRAEINRYFKGKIESPEDSKTIIKYYETMIQLLPYIFDDKVEFGYCPSARIDAMLFSWDKHSQISEDIEAVLTDFKNQKMSLLNLYSWYKRNLTYIPEFIAHLFGESDLDKHFHLELLDYKFLVTNSEEAKVDSVKMQLAHGVIAVANFLKLFRGESDDIDIGDPLALVKSGRVSTRAIFVKNHMVDTPEGKRSAQLRVPDNVRKVEIGQEKYKPRRLKLPEHRIEMIDEVVQINDRCFGIDEMVEAITLLQDKIIPHAAQRKYELSIAK